MSDTENSLDDYEVALADGVEDETLLENPGIRKFTIRSYGADYTVDSLVKRMRQSAFKVPDFQRQYVWTLKHASKFIESLLMGLPVPGIFLYKENDTNEHLVIDGQQRLRTLQAFYDGIFKDKSFKLVGVREPWNNKTYKQLDQSDILKLDDSIVHATIFQQDRPQDVLDSIYFVFERINTGGIRLSPQEIRNCISLGPFINLVKQINLYPNWRSIFGPINNRSKDEELIIRFFALFYGWKKYIRPMNKFLNDFSDHSNKLKSEQLSEMKDVFCSTIDRVEAALGVRAFRPTRALNAAVFDSVMVGIATRLKDPMAKPISDAEIVIAYENLLQDATYISAFERSTADEENVKARITKAIVAFK